jgi:hypothetical protein
MGGQMPLPRDSEPTDQRTWAHSTPNLQSIVLARRIGTPPRDARPIELRAAVGDDQVGDHADQEARGDHQ